MAHQGIRYPFPILLMGGMFVHSWIPPSALVRLGFPTYFSLPTRLTWALLESSDLLKNTMQTILIQGVLHVEASTLSM